MGFRNQWKDSYKLSVTVKLSVNEKKKVSEEPD